MWVKLWVTVTLSILSGVLSDNEGKVQDGDSFSWGWQLTSGPESEIVGQYYVKLPQFPQIHQAVPNGSQEISNLPYVDVHPSTDIYLHQHQLPILSNQQHQIFHIPNASTVQNPYIPQLYNIQTQQPLQSQINNDNDQTDNRDRFNMQSTKFNQRESINKAKEENSLPINQVFKNNCSDDDGGLEKTSKEIYSDMQKSKELFAEVPFYEIQNLDGDFGLRGTTNRPLSYRGAVHFRVETPRPHARNERFYFTTVATPIVPRNTVNISQEGINKLVEFTQDLISNDDLIKINHAIERNLNDQNDDIIKAKPRSNPKIQQFRDNLLNDTWRKNQSVRDKIREIFSSDIKPVEKENSHKEILETNFNDYKFTSPIVVADTIYDSKNQIVDNIVSTMIPYIVDGYEIVSVKSSQKSSNTTCRDENSTEEIVKVTPRPLWENYLTPITVGLRLLNANGTINSFEDFETSDSEIVQNTVANPNTGKTTVEIQESIPIEITHINDVEVHEYLEEGRSIDKEPFAVARTLYNKYVDALRSSKKIQENMNKIFYKYGTMNNYGNLSDQDDEQRYTDSKENFESSENIQPGVEDKPESNDSNQRSDVVTYENNYADKNPKIIQPIVIEKEIPVTKFVDRFIEKQVPYTERVEVPVPVDRPVPVTVPVEKIVEKPVELTRYIDKSYPVEVPRPYPVEVPRPYPVQVNVPYPVEQKIYIDRPIHVPYPVEKVVEKQVIQQVPILTPVGIPYEVQVPVEHQVLYPIAIEKPYPVAVEVEKTVPVEKVVHKEVRVPYPVEKRVPYPVPYETKVAVPYPVERRIPIPVEKIVEKPVTVTKIVEKPVHIEIPVPHPVAIPVHVPQPVPVDRIIEKNVPYPVPVDRVVEKQVPVPYPVEKVVEKIIHKPVLVTKYVDKPYPVERRVPYQVERIVERKVPYPVQVPVEVKVPYPVEKIIEKHVAVPVYRRYMEKGEESRTNYRYENPENNQQRYNFDSNYSKIKLIPNIQSTMWGNQNTSTFKYNNTQDKKDFKTSQSLKNYLNYLVNSQYGPYQYVPIPLQDSNLGKNKNYLFEVKLRRTDRVPKMTNLRIEYGGFRPPLVPSTEVDLDGLPVNKE